MFLGSNADAQKFLSRPAEVIINMIAKTVRTTPRTIRMVAVMERETMGMPRLVPSSVPNWEVISPKEYKLKKSE